MSRGEDPLDGQWIEQKLNELANFTDVPGQMQRLTLSPAHRHAAGRMAEWFQAAGMETRLDAAGTLIGRYEAQQADSRTLLIGSHIDTVCNAGNFDGTLGVVAGLAVVAHLHKAGQRLPFAIEVAAFGDEEGVRFPTTLTGSRAMAGQFDLHVLDEVDADNISRRQALKEFGVSSAPVRRADPARTIGYVEVHIEQGPVLEAENLPLGIVSAINGTSRGLVRVTGTAGHAGTLPMAMRRDALAAAAEMMLAIEDCASSQTDLVATVGRIDVPGAAVNVVPGMCHFSLDLRSPDDAARRAALDDIRARLALIGARRGVAAALDITHAADATICNPALAATLASALGQNGFAAFQLPSGAGHDAMAFRNVLPVTMLFVRCRGGISHNPLEYCLPADMGRAAKVLHDFVRLLAEME